MFIFNDRVPLEQALFGVLSQRHLLQGGCSEFQGSGEGTANPRTIVCHITKIRTGK
jgi:hypothetical protein